MYVLFIELFNTVCISFKHKLTQYVNFKNIYIFYIWGYLPQLNLLFIFLYVSISCYHSNCNVIDIILSVDCL